MRSTMTCPKCNARKIWRIEKFQTESDSTNGWTLHVVYQRALGGDKENIGQFDCYICATCGYSEFYAQNLHGLVHAPHAGVTFWDGDKLHQGPTR